MRGLDFANKNDKKAAYESQDRAERYSGTIKYEFISNKENIIKEPDFLLRKYYMIARYGFTFLLLGLSLIINLNKR